GHAVDLVEVDRERLQAAAHERGRHGRSPVAQAAQAGVVPLGHVGHLEEEAVDGGHEEGVRDPVGGDLVEDGVRYHVPHHEGAPADCHAVQRPAAAAHVEERHGHHVHAVGGEGEGGRGGGGVGQQAAVGEHGAFGETGGARGV